MRVEYDDRSPDRNALVGSTHAALSRIFVIEALAGPVSR
ncbi:hypothetical protein BN2364_4028 [Alloalcanivorax xenomutans]|nr:hypothetical protein BN2364_4028 [Alloalcanivorax xenomutans]